MPLLSDVAIFDVSRSPPPGADTSRPIKRKLDSKVDEGEIKSKRSIKKRRSGKGKGPADDDGTLDLGRGINTAIGQMDSRLLADWVAQQIRRFAPDLSMVELEDLYLPGTNVLTPYKCSRSDTHPLCRASSQGHQHLGQATDPPRPTRLSQTLQSEGPRPQEITISTEQFGISSYSCYNGLWSEGC